MLNVLQKAESWSSFSKRKTKIYNIWEIKSKKVKNKNKIK